MNQPQLQWSLGTVLALAVCAGCTASGHAVVDRTTSASSTPAVSAEPCRASQLTFWALAQQGWTGGDAEGWVVRNRSERGCVLEGYPTLTLLDKAGKRIPQPVRYVVDGTYREHAPQVVPLPPGGKATVIMSGTVAGCRGWIEGELMLVLDAATKNPSRSDGLPLDLYPTPDGIEKVQLCPVPTSISPWQPGDVSKNVGGAEHTVPPGP